MRFLRSGRNKNGTDSGKNLFENDTDNNRLWSLEIINVVTGEKKFCGKVAGVAHCVNISGWKPGIYAVQVVSGEERISEKIVIHD